MVAMTVVYDGKLNAILVNQDQNLVDNSHARHVTHLIRITGKWPITAFDNLSSEERKAQQIQKPEDGGVSVWFL